MSIENIKVPDLGDASEVEVIELLVSVGQKVAENDSLLVLESDKAAMEIPAPMAGVVTSIAVQLGDQVSTGSEMLSLEVAAAQQSESAKSKEDEEDEESAAATQGKDSIAKADTTKPAPAAETQAAAKIPEPRPEAPAHAISTQPASLQLAKDQGKPGGKVYAGPAVRKLARELGVDLHLLVGSGTKSRIIKENVYSFVKNRINAATGSSAGVSTIPDIDFSQFGEIEQQPRSKLHRLTAANMHRSWTAVPHVAQFNEIDVTDLEDFRAGLKSETERRGVKLTFLPFLLKACAKTLLEYPQFNVSLHSSGEYVIQKKYVHIGMAVATEAGLVVPVIRNVDQKTIWQLAAEVIELSARAKNRKLRSEEMQGACFTVSSLGAIGGTGFIPIVNAPEVAILGVAKTAIKPVYIGAAFVPRKILPVTLCYDHKAVNGVDGGLFASYLAKLLADVRYLAL